MGLFIILALMIRFLYIFYNKNIYLIKKSLREKHPDFLVVEGYQR
jgi:hypothetical protein